MRFALQLQAVTGGGLALHDISAKLQRCSRHALAARLHIKTSAVMTASATQAGPRQMLQLENYDLPAWAEGLADHVGAPVARHAHTSPHHKAWPRNYCV